MGKNFSFYEQTGILIPGATLVFGLLFFFPEFRMLFFSDGVSIGGLTKLNDGDVIEVGRVRLNFLYRE